MNPGTEDHGTLEDRYGPFRPLASRLAIPVSLTVAAMILLASCFVAMITLKKSLDRIERETEMVAISIGHAAESLASDADLQRLVGLMAAEPGVEQIAVVYGSPPRVLACSHTRLIGNPYDEAAVSESIRSDAWTVTRSAPLKITRADRPLENVEVIVRMDARPVRNEAAAWTFGIAAMLLASPVATLLIAWITLQRRVVRPIEDMVTAVREGGEFAHIPVVSNDEIGVLASTINRSHREAAVSAIELATSREEAEQALREIAALRRALDEHLILSIADRSGKIIDANKGFCMIAGYTRDEILGEDHKMLNSGHHPKSFWIDVWKTIASGQAWRGEVCNRAKDGSLYWVDSTIVPYLNARGEIERYVSIRFDITAQKKAEEALVAAQERAESISRSKSEFLANMSHEIRTPMTAIIGFTDLLKLMIDESPEHERHHEYVETIQRNGKHLLELINDILDVSKIEAGGISLEKTDANPAELLGDTCELMRVKADSKGITIESECAEDVPAWVSTDPGRLRQILLNLIGNAVKFTEHGSVRVRCEYDAPASDGEAGTLRFSVRDSGIGMTREQVSHLFGAFIQADSSTSRKYGGTGLGLHISRRLVQMMGGDISVVSEPGEGSTFAFSVKAAVSRPASPGPIPGGAHADGSASLADAFDRRDTPRLRGVRIMLAEDGPDNVRLIRFFLTKAGATVDVVSNGRELVEALSDDGTIDGRFDPATPADLILTDIQMPEMDGYESTTHLREMGCPLPIIALTAHAMCGDEQRCIDAGCDAYASKPLDWPALIGLCADAAAGNLRRSDAA